MNPPTCPDTAKQVCGPQQGYGIKITLFPQHVFLASLFCPDSIKQPKHAEIKIFPHRSDNQRLMLNVKRDFCKKEKNTT